MIVHIKINDINILLVVCPHHIKYLCYVCHIKSVDHVHYPCNMDVDQMVYCNGFIFAYSI